VVPLLRRNERPDRQAARGTSAATAESEQRKHSVNGVVYAQWRRRICVVVNKAGLAARLAR